MPTAGVVSGDPDWRDGILELCCVLGVWSVPRQYFPFESTILEAQLVTRAPLPHQ